MKLIESFKPKFWAYQNKTIGPLRREFNLRRLWRLSSLLTALVALVPLIIVTLVDYKVTEKSIESEIILRTSRLVSNTKRAAAFFFAERKAAMNFIIQDYSVEDLKKQSRLKSVLEHLKEGFGGFADLGVIDSLGIQQTYVGQYNLKGRDYSRQEWFKTVQDRGIHISDVFLGYRNVPHLVISVKKDIPSGSFFVLRATLDIDTFINNVIAALEVGSEGDAFIINHNGILQTPSRSHGRILEKISLPVPEYFSRTKVLELNDTHAKPIVVGYAYIADTPFILMIVKQKENIMKPWNKARSQLTWFLAASITIILLVTIGVSTYLVNKIYMADQKRIIAIHEMEHSNRMASIGRLAAGVAHEINNPLAIINEKAGLMMDLYKFKKHLNNEEKITGLIDSILSSVERCATITSRLLGFARHMDVTVQSVDLHKVINDVLGFMGKEAEFRSLSISVNIADDIPKFDTDRGKLQQILLNLVDNAFAALSDGGSLDIIARRKSEGFVDIIVKDTGHGMSKSDIKRIFEPFFSTKTKTGGTGLGLSITYGLVKELDGKINVRSKKGKGATFTVTLPLKNPKELIKQRGA
ncbi:MAG: sensor histidine kinase [Deltaproteobacteria bacterium]|nr:sensor histidine kinase [Deltaproteobacteria bacterium]